MSSERSRLELLKHTFLKHPTPRFVSRTSVVAEILWKIPKFHIKTPKFTKFPGKMQRPCNAAVVFPYTLFKVIILTKIVCFTLQDPNCRGFPRRNPCAECFLTDMGLCTFGPNWRPQMKKNTWLYPQKTHISAKKNANIREKNANIQKNPPIHKWRLLRGEILVKIVALPVHKFNSVEHCVFAWASLWTWLANPLCPWFIMIPDQINSFRWFSSRWEPFLSRRKSDNRCWWNLWITEAKNPMLPSGNLLLFATYKPRPSRNSGFTQFYPASVRMVDLSIVFCKRVPGGSLPEAPWLIQSHLIPWQFAMVICHGPNWNRWFT